MKRYFASAFVAVLVLGVGCEDVSITRGDVPVEVEETAAADGRIAADHYVGNGYEIAISKEYTVEENYDNLRIQNFVGQDDPQTIYADEAFFIEIREVADNLSVDWERSFRETHESIEEMNSNGEDVIYGKERVMQGDSWSGTSYFRGGDDVVVIYLYAQHEAGLELAEAVVSNIQWK